MKSQLCTELDSSSQPKSLIVAEKPKKPRHRRVGSGTIASPKSSPNRRAVQSEPCLVESGTQTDLNDTTLLRQEEYLQSQKVCLNCTKLMTNSLSSPEELIAPGTNSMSTSNMTFQDACSGPEEVMSAGEERLEMRDVSDDDNLEILGRKVTALSERFTRKGNAASYKRGFVSLSENGDVTVIRCKDNLNNDLRDEGCDDSWTDEEGESDYKHSLRRKR